jgi:OmpA-OmpF porin, OOP family
MSIKKLLVLAAAGVASSAALAGTVTYTAKPAPSAPMATNNNGVYVEGMAGYNRHGLEDSLSAPSTASWSHGRGNFAFGADIGYQFQRYLSAELGGIYTLKSKINFSNGGTMKYTPWYAYLAAKLALPVYDNVSIFTKFGLGYQKIKYSVDNVADATAAPLQTDSNWGPMFGVGAAYNFTPEIYVDAQWLRFTGKVKDAGVETTAPNIFLLGVGYKFAI